MKDINLNEMDYNHKGTLNKNVLPKKVKRWNQ